MKKMTVYLSLAVFILALSAVAFAVEEEKAPSSFDEKQAVGTKATCPVMGSTVEIDENTPHSEAEGKHVYFCCAACKPKFDADPEKYLKK